MEFKQVSKLIRNSKIGNLKTTLALTYILYYLLIVRTSRQSLQSLVEFVIFRKILSILSR